MKPGEKITIGEKYMPAMKITDQAVADAYFEECVRHCLSFGTTTRQQAEQIERDNLGYFAGYYDRETRLRVERLFKCKHPLLGTVEETDKLTPEMIFSKGVAHGFKRANKS